VRRVLELRRRPRPLAPAAAHRLTAKGLRLYRALLEAVREAKGERAVRRVLELRRRPRPLAPAAAHG